MVESLRRIVKQPKKTFEYIYIFILQILYNKKWIVQRQYKMYKLLEAIDLVLTGQLNGRNINYEISPFLFSKICSRRISDKIEQVLLEIKQQARSVWQYGGSRICFE